MTDKLGNIFSEIYKDHGLGRGWCVSDVNGGIESASGRGSELKHTTSIRKWLPKLINDREIGSIVDAGCGDFNWMKEIDLEIPYMGLDIVPDMVKKNIDLYGRLFPVTKLFAIADITKDVLPKADLVICRDVIYHLSFTNIRKVITNIVTAARKYILITNTRDVTENNDIDDGGFRRLSLRLPPLNFPAPLERFEDCEAALEDMYLYSVSTLEEYLKHG